MVWVSNPGRNKIFLSSPNCSGVHVKVKNFEGNSGSALWFSNPGRAKIFLSSPVCSGVHVKVTKFECNPVEASDRPFGIQEVEVSRISTLF